MAELILTTLALILIASILVYKYLTWNYNYWKKRGIPGPEPRALFGNFPNTVLGKRPVVYDVEEVYNEYKSSYRLIGVYVTRNPEILVLDPAIAHEILVGNFRKFRDNSIAELLPNDNFIGLNPFFSKGEEWKTRRTEGLSGLSPNKLNLAYPIWKDSADKLNGFLKERTGTIGSIELEVKDLCHRFTSSVLGDFLWGIDTGVFSKADEPNLIMNMETNMVTEAFAGAGFSFISEFIPFLSRFLGNNFYSKETANFFSKITQDAIALRLKDKDKNNRSDFLNHLVQLQDKKQLSHDDLVGHIATVVLDGYETTATAIYHTLYFLAKYPAAQEKLRNEILDALEGDGFPTFDTLQNLKYLDQCLYETLRIISPVPVMTRVCSEATELEVGNGKRVTVEPGTYVTVPVFSYHHDPEYFPKPYEYNPERFDNDANLELMKKGIFLPFGDGPRICMGMRLGQFEAKTAIVTILKTYRLKCCSRTQAEKKPDTKSFILGYDGDLWLTFERL